jgi:hypothetical protein
MRLQPPTQPIPSVEYVWVPGRGYDRYEVKPGPKVMSLLMCPVCHVTPHMALYTHNGQPHEIHCREHGLLLVNEDGTWRYGA